MDFKGTITTIRLAQVELARLEFAAAVEKGKIQAGMANIIKVCEPACLAAAKAYNEAPVLSLLIEPLDSIRVSINAKTGTLSLVVRLRYRSGTEPDEDFDADEVRQIQAALQPHLDRELASASIPLAFESLLVPHGYHMK